MPGMGHPVFSRSLEGSAVSNPQFTREGSGFTDPGSDSALSVT